MALCGVGWWAQKAKLERLDRQIAADEKRQRDLQVVQQQVDEFQRKKATLENKVAVIERLRLSQKSPVHMLDEISKALPDYVWLVTYSESRGAVSLKGQSNSLAAVADFMNSLQRSGWFPAIDLASASEQSNLVDFDLTGQFTDPEIAAREAKAKNADPGARRAEAVRRHAWLRIASRNCQSSHSSGSRSSLLASSSSASGTSGTRTRWVRPRRSRTGSPSCASRSRPLEATANKLPEFKREVQALEARLEILKRILPPEKEMPDLMKRVQYLASQSSLRVAAFKPAAVRQTEFYQEVPISLNLEGTFHNLGYFLDRVSRMSRLVNIGDLRIQAQGQPTINSTITIAATATTYVYNDNAAAAADQKGRPRR